MSLRAPLAYLRHLLHALPGATFLALSLLVTTALLEGIGLLVLVPLLDLVGVEAGDGAAGRLASQIAAVFDRLGLPLELTTVLPIYVALIGLTAIASAVAQRRSASVVHAYAAKLRRDLHAALLGASWRFHLDQRRSRMHQLLTSEVERSVSATDALLTMLVRTATLAVYLALAAYLSLAMTVLVTLAGGVLFLVFHHWTRRANALGRQVVEAHGQLHDAANEDLEGLVLTRAHAADRPLLERFAERADAVARGYLAAVRVSTAVNAGSRLLAAGVLATFVYMAVRVFTVSTAALLMLLYLFSRVVPIVQTLQAQSQLFAASVPAHDAVLDLRARAHEAREHGGDLPVPPLRHVLSLHAVHVAYRSDVPVLRGVTLDIEAGTTTALVGPSGEGKSTLVDVLTGILQPDHGRIDIDGVPLRPETMRAWRSRIGFVPQDPFMFHDTIRNNLRLTRPQATEAEMREAMRAAFADRFVTALPDGLDTVVGDRGVRLSAGERQRLALARALLRRPDLLILDEATSNLDTESERHVQDAIEALHGRVTVVMVAHRLWTIRNADAIHVIDGGRVVESGTFEELLSRPEGRFAALYQRPS